MSNTPSVSIIIPAYNVEDYLVEALDSIKSQTQYPDEVILIDDGSRDSTLSLAESYTFPFKYEVISVNNGGQGKARNTGRNLATSDYIYYFDSDDLIHKDFIKTIKQEILHCEFPDIILFSGKSFYDTGYNELRSLNYSRGFNKYFKSRSEFLEHSSSSNSLFCQPCCYISKREVWVNNDLYFPNDFLEDEAVFFPLLFACHNYKVINNIFFFRRIRNESTMTMKPNIKHVNGAINCINSIIQLMSHDVTKQERIILNKRLSSYALAYLSLAKKSNCKISLNILKSVLIKTKSPLFVSKSLLIVSGAINSKAISYLIKSTRKNQSL